MKKKSGLVAAALGLLFASSSMATAPTSADILWDGGQPTMINQQALNGADDRSIMVSADSSPQSSEVPEPGSLLLIGIGLAGIGLVRRRRS